MTVSEAATSAHSPEARVDQQLAQIRSESQKAELILQLQRENTKLTEQVSKLEKSKIALETKVYQALYGRKRRYSKSIEPPGQTSVSHASTSTSYSEHEVRRTAEFNSEADRLRLHGCLSSSCWLHETQLQMTILRLEVEKAEAIAHSELAALSQEQLIQAQRGTLQEQRQNIAIKNCMYEELLARARSWALV